MTSFQFLSFKLHQWEKRCRLIRFGLTSTQTKDCTISDSASGHACRVDPRFQKVCCLLRISSVGQMRGSDDQSSIADKVTWCTDDQRILSRIIDDPAAILSVLRIPEEDHSHNLGDDAAAQARVGNRFVGDCSALAVASGDDDAVGASGGSLLEEGGHFLDAVWVGAAWQ